MERTASVWFNSSIPLALALARRGGDDDLMWNVAQEDLPYIPSHWFDFPPPTPLHNYLVGFIYVILAVAGMSGNGLVIWIFSTAKSLRTPSNMFVVTLAIFDLLMVSKGPILIYNSFNLGFPSWPNLCQYCALVGAISGIGASVTNACIAYDRYNTIAHPLDGKMSRGKALVMCLFIWAYTLPWAILPLLEIWGRYVPEGYLTTCTFDYLSDAFNDKLFVGSIFTFSYVLPMLAIIFFYSQIVGHVVRHEKELRAQAKKMNVQSLRSNQPAQNEAVEIRIAKAAITVCFMFVAAWTPYAIVALIGAFGNRALLTPHVSMIPAVTCKTVACIDPFVYAISHPRYRLELIKKLPCLTGCIAESETASSTKSEIVSQTTTT